MLVLYVCSYVAIVKCGCFLRFVCGLCADVGFECALYFGIGFERGCGECWR